MWVIFLVIKLFPKEVKKIIYCFSGGGGGGSGGDGGGDGGGGGGGCGGGCSFG